MITTRHPSLRFFVRAVPYIAVGSLVVVVESWLWLGRPPGWRRESALVVQEKGLDLGNVWSQREFPWVLKVENPTDEDIAVQDIKKTCSCTIAEPRSFVVPAGGSVPVHLKFNLWPRSEKQASQAAWPMEAAFAPELRERSGAYEPWRIRASVHRYPVRVSPEQVDFGDGLVEGDKFPTRQVDVQCLDGVTGLTASCDRSFATVDVRGATNEAQRRQVGITLRPGLPAGEHKSTVKLTPIVSAGSLPPGLGPPPDYPLEVRAVVGHDVYVMPASIPLGAIRIGEAGQSTVTLRSAHGRPFAVTQTRVEPVDCVRVEPAVEQGTSRTFRVSQRLAKLGDQSGRVRFTVQEDGGAKSYTVEAIILLHGIGK